MSRPKIVAHSLVNNEEKWIWYSLMSVIDCVDEVYVWDTGSTDHTVDIIRSISSPKIKFRQLVDVDKNTFTSYRQQMLDMTSADWVLILDGDEIWPADALSTSLGTITGSSAPLNYLVSRYYNLLGDVFHYQDEHAGRYKIGKFSGHISIRFINLHSIPGLHFALPYGQEGLFDANNVPIQNLLPDRQPLIPLPYLHATHLCRSDVVNSGSVMMRSKKFKYELGHTFSEDLVYPACFYQVRPNIVSSPWTHRSPAYFLNSLWQTPLKHFKRMLF